MLNAGRGEHGGRDIVLLCRREKCQMGKPHVTHNAETERQSKCEEIRIVYYLALCHTRF
jgi:hypothetical protein